MHVFHISYNHTECDFPFPGGDIVHVLTEDSPIKKINCNNQATKKLENY